MFKGVSTIYPGGRLPHKLCTTHMVILRQWWGKTRVFSSRKLEFFIVQAHIHDSYAWLVRSVWSPFQQVHHVSCSEWWGPCSSWIHRGLACHRSIQTERTFRAPVWLDYKEKTLQIIITVIIIIMYMMTWPTLQNQVLMFVGLDRTRVVCSGYVPEHQGISQAVQWNVYEHIALSVCAVVSSMCNLKLFFSNDPFWNGLVRDTAC